MKAAKVNRYALGVRYGLVLANLDAAVAALASACSHMGSGVMSRTDGDALLAAAEELRQQAWEAAARERVKVKA